jgi:hypothetical protein
VHTFFKHLEKKLKVLDTYKRVQKVTIIIKNDTLAYKKNILAHTWHEQKQNFRQKNVKKTSK